MVGEGPPPGLYPQARTEEDIRILQIMLCGAFFPNYVVDRPREWYYASVCVSVCVKNVSTYRHFCIFEGKQRC